MSALFKRRDYPRLCDVCGHRWMFSQLRYIGLGRYACPDDKGMLTREQIARHMARPIPQLFRPRAHPRPMVDTAATYQATEAEILRVVMTYALLASSVDSTGTILVGPTTVTAAAAGLYLADMVIEAMRPALWLSKAQTKAAAIGDFLLSRQYGAPGGVGPAEATTSLRYGGILDNGNVAIATLDATLAGLTFLRLATITGAQKYLDGADRVGAFLRGVQRCDQFSSQFTVNSLAGSGRSYIGGWPTAVNASKGLSNVFLVSGAISLWFWAELRALRGGSAVYGSASGGDFVSSTSATIDTIIADALAFYVTGKIAEVGSATPLAPLSATTPRREYDAFLNTGGGDGLFHLSGNGLFAFDMIGLRGVFEAVGYSPQVAAVYEWLMSFTSNPAFATAPNDIPSKVRNLATGTYDPTFALSTGLLVTDGLGHAVAMNGSDATFLSTYQPSVMGFLAPIHIASGRSLKALKDELEQPRPLRGASGPAGRYRLGYPSLGDNPSVNAGSLGLSFQATSQAAKRDVFGSAGVGMLYRHQPQSWNGVNVF